MPAYIATAPFWYIVGNRCAEFIVWRSGGQISGYAGSGVRSSRSCTARTSSRDHGSRRRLSAMVRADAPTGCDGSVRIPGSSAITRSAIAFPSRSRCS